MLGMKTIGRGDADHIRRLFPLLKIHRAKYKKGLYNAHAQFLSFPAHPQGRSIPFQDSVADHLGMALSNMAATDYGKFYFRISGFHYSVCFVTRLFCKLYFSPLSLQTAVPVSLKFEAVPEALIHPTCRAGLPTTSA
jgi:hypothetical protein